MTGTKAPVVFIHGLWLHATSWQPWQDLFAEAGYEPSAPGWPGEQVLPRLPRGCVQPQAVDEDDGGVGAGHDLASLR